MLEPQILNVTEALLCPTSSSSSYCLCLSLRWWRWWTWTSTLCSPATWSCWPSVWLSWGSITCPWNSSNRSRVKTGEHIWTGFNTKTECHVKSLTASGGSCFVLFCFAEWREVIMARVRLVRHWAICFTVLISLCYREWVLNSAEESMWMWSYFFLKIIFKIASTSETPEYHWLSKLSQNPSCLSNSTLGMIS